jgi:hypothetical protein
MMARRVSAPCLRSKALGIIQLMPKQCSQCGSVADDNALNCDACGARSWSEVPNQFAKVWIGLSLLLVLGLILFIYLRVVGRILLK